MVILAQLLLLIVVEKNVISNKGYRQRQTALFPGRIEGKNSADAEFSWEEAQMKKRLSLFVLSAVLICLVGALPARAGIISSSVSFNEACPVCPLNGSGTAVDMMEVFIQPVAGVTFQSPGLNVYDAGWGASGWTENDVNPKYSNASGLAMSNFNYILHFNIDDVINPTTVAIGVDVYYFQNILGVETLIDAAGLTYDGPISFQTDVNNWGVTGVLNQRGLPGENSTPVPEPATWLCVGGGMLLLGLARRRNARTR